MHGARLSGLEARMNSVEDQLSDVDARGSEESDNLANERDLDRFILTGDCVFINVVNRANVQLLTLTSYITLIGMAKPATVTHIDVLTFNFFYDLKRDFCFLRSDKACLCGSTCTDRYCASVCSAVRA